MDKKVSVKDQFVSGLITNNPIFVQFIGMCPCLAVTTSVMNAVGMGIAVIVVLTCSNLIISLLRKFIPKQVRIAAYVVIISGFVTAVELLIKAFFPAINNALGIFIPLIVVNCLILARAEAFASKNKVLPSVVDGITMGLGYTCAIILVAFFRELLGTGYVFAGIIGEQGIPLLTTAYVPATIFVLPTGALITLSFLCAAFQKIVTKVQDKKLQARMEADRALAVEKVAEDVDRKESASNV